MVELINEDYAHFVNLSSNLVGLKTSIDSINTNIDVRFLILFLYEMSS